MVKVSARSEKNREKVELRSYKAKEALQLLKDTATAKFNESAEAHISLKLDTKYADQQLRVPCLLASNLAHLIPELDKLLQFGNSARFKYWDHSS